MRVESGPSRGISMTIARPTGPTRMASGPSMARAELSFRAPKISPNLSETRGTYRHERTVPLNTVTAPLLFPTRKIDAPAMPTFAPVKDQKPVQSVVATNQRKRSTADFSPFIPNPELNLAKPPKALSLAKFDTTGFDKPKPKTLITGPFVPNSEVLNKIPESLPIPIRLELQTLTTKPEENNSPSVSPVVPENIQVILPKIKEQAKNHEDEEETLQKKVAVLYKEKGSIVDVLQILKTEQATVPQTEILRAVHAFLEQTTIKPQSTKPEVQQQQEQVIFLAAGLVPPEMRKDEEQKQYVIDERAKGERYMLAISIAFKKSIWDKIRINNNDHHLISGEEFAKDIQDQTSKKAMSGLALAKGIPDGSYLIWIKDLAALSERSVWNILQESLQLIEKSLPVTVGNAGKHASAEEVSRVLGAKTEATKKDFALTA